MARNLCASSCRSAALAATALSAVHLACAAADAAAAEPPSAASITVHAGHYVLRGQAIDDLDVLVRTLAPMRPKTVRLDACAQAAERAQRAAAHRLRAMNLELRWLPPGAPECRAAASERGMPASLRYGPAPYGIDDTAVDRWWHAQMP